MKRILKKIVLRKQINKAKKMIQCEYGYGPTGLNPPFMWVYNYQEVSNVLGYECSLGMTLFIREYIAKNISTKECVRFLLANTSNHPTRN